MKICPVCSTQYPSDVRFCPNDGQTLRVSSPAHDRVGQVYLAEHVKTGRKVPIAAGVVAVLAAGVEESGGP